MWDDVSWEKRELFSVSMIQIIVLTLLSAGSVSVVFAEDEVSENTPEKKYFRVEQEVLDDGKKIEKAKIVGPPSPPVGYERGPVVSEPDQKGQDTDSSINNLLKEWE